MARYRVAFRGARGLSFGARLGEREIRTLNRLGPLLHGRMALIVGDRTGGASGLLDLPVSLQLPQDVHPSESFPNGKPWPYGDGCMDLVLWLHVHEEWASPESLFSESARILNPGGQIAILGFHPIWSRIFRSRIAGSVPGPVFHPMRVSWLNRKLRQQGFGIRTLLYGARWPGAFMARGTTAQGMQMDFGLPLIYVLLALRQTFARIPGRTQKPVPDPASGPIILPSRRVA